MMIYYRPEWTCGRYNSKHEVAILYNLIEGKSYFFESYSAKVIHCILESGRNGSLRISDIAETTCIAEESLLPFFRVLEAKHLVESEKPSPEYIKAYRQKVFTYRIDNPISQSHIVERISMDTDDAETRYAEAIDDGESVASVMFELTYNCSEMCIHCYNPGAVRSEYDLCTRGSFNELTLTEYKSLIDDLVMLGLEKVCLTGGDPFSTPLVWDLIKYLYEKDIAFDIYTNGQRLINREMELVGLYPRSVGVSLYSGVSEDHDSITRVKGSWEKTMQVIKRLAEQAVPLNLKCCIMQPNLHSYNLVSEIAKKYGAAQQYELSITESNDGDVCAKKLRLTENQLKVVLRDTLMPLYVGINAKEYGSVPKSMDKAACVMAHTSFCITPDGKLRGCCAFPMDFGDLRKCRIAEIVAKSPVLKDWRNAIISNYDECGRYDYCSFCNLCSGNNYVEHGDYRKPAETNCFMAKVRASLAQELKKTKETDLSREELIRRIKDLEIMKPTLRRDIKGK